MTFRARSLRALSNQNGKAGIAHLKNRSHLTRTQTCQITPSNLLTLK